MTEQADAAAILRRVRDEVLTDESRWTKGEDAHDAGGHEVPVDDANAVRWCLGGAVYLIESDYSARQDAELLLRAATGDRGIVAFNDDPGTTFADVRAVLDRAIALAAGEDV